ncbi:hypothetical protein D3C77_545840 [compost metagenome]
MYADQTVLRVPAQAQTSTQGRTATSGVHHYPSPVLLPCTIISHIPLRALAQHLNTTGHGREDHANITRGVSQHRVESNTIQVPTWTIGVAQGIEPHRYRAFPHRNAGTARSMAISQEAIE